jgi:hypothetical protein
MISLNPNSNAVWSVIALNDLRRLMIHRDAFSFREMILLVTRSLLRLTQKVNLRDPLPIKRGKCR